MRVRSERARTARWMAPLAASRAPRWRKICTAVSGAMSPPVDSGAEESQISMSRCIWAQCRPSPVLRRRQGRCFVGVAVERGVRRGQHTCPHQVLPSLVQMETHRALSLHSPEHVQQHSQQFTPASKRRGVQAQPRRGGSRDSTVCHQPGPRGGWGGGPAAQECDGSQSLRAAAQEGGCQSAQLQRQRAARRRRRPGPPIRGTAGWRMPLCRFRRVWKPSVGLRRSRPAPPPGGSSRAAGGWADGPAGSRPSWGASGTNNEQQGQRRAAGEAQPWTWQCGSSARRHTSPQLPGPVVLKLGAAPAGTRTAMRAATVRRPCRAAAPGWLGADGGQGY